MKLGADNLYSLTQFKRLTERLYLTTFLSNERHLMLLSKSSVFQVFESATWVLSYVSDLSSSTSRSNISLNFISLDEVRDMHLQGPHHHHPQGKFIILNQTIPNTKLHQLPNCTKNYISTVPVQKNFLSSGVVQELGCCQAQLSQSRTQAELCLTTEPWWDIGFI